ncbi:Protein T10B10.4 a [Aphelenchoides avenae]|nr:Protein T10B10.4 a [Aphelenchus avenae]
MVSVTLHGDEDDAKMVKLRLAKLPGVGVRFKETGELAAFEYTDGCGFLANLYTVPEFRHRGIGTVLERRLSQRVAFELGLCPAKNVSVNRPRVVKMSEENPLWTAVYNEDGEKQVMRWAYLCKEKRPDIIMHEN